MIQEHNAIDLLPNVLNNFLIQSINLNVSILPLSENVKLKSDDTLQDLQNSSYKLMLLQLCMFFGLCKKHMYTSVFV